MAIKKYDVQSNKESIKLINVYNRCLDHYDILKTEPLFISDMLSTVYLCNNIYLEHNVEEGKVIKKMITDIDNGLIALHFKCKQGSVDIQQSKKAIRHKVKELRRFLLGK